MVQGAYQMNNPAPSKIIEARHAAGLTQTQAAHLVHAACRSWQQWEAGDRKMHPAFWELFCIKSGKK
jgi:DNA-binding XRE family transcriptional regulator